MSDLAPLRRTLRSYTNVALDIYDRSEERAAARLLAHFRDNRPPAGSGPGVTKGSRDVRLDSLFIFPEVYAWADEALTGAGFDRLEWAVRVDGYRTDGKIDEVEIGRPETVGTLEAFAQAVGPAWARFETKLAMQVIRNGASGSITYDGENFFSASHVHPSAKGTFGNILTGVTPTDWSAPATPTVVEFRAGLRAAAQMLMSNSVIQAELLSADRMKRDLVVIVHNQAHFSAAEELRTKERIGTNTEANEFAGTFQLFWDPKPTSGEENYFEVLYLPAGGPKPAIIVVDTPPARIELDTNVYSKGELWIGWKGQMGAKAFMPQTAVQVRPT